MEIIESLLISKYNELEECEDGIIITDNFACIIDGATNKMNTIINGKTPGIIIKDLIISTIKEKFFKEICAYEAIQLLNNSIEDFYIKNNLLEIVKDNPEHRFSATVIIFNDYKKELWIVGDCQCIANNKLYSKNKRVDTLFAEVRAFYNKVELQNGSSIEDLRKRDVGREFIKPLLIKQSVFQNSNFDKYFSYEVIDGTNIKESKIKIIKIENDHNEVILASDGYPFLHDTLEKSEKKLKEIIEKDPLFIEIYKSTKGLMDGQCSFDDRSYLRIKIT